jgi:hypothetical protein
MTETQKTEKKIAAIDLNAARVVRAVTIKAPNLCHGYVSPTTMKWLNDHARMLADEIVKPLIGHAVPEVVISADINNRRQLGHYKIGRDGLGLNWRISMNVVHLGRPRGEVLGTLLHEILHAVQHAHGEPGKGNFHNKEFIGWCERAGIPTNSKGHDLGIVKTGVFDSYLTRHGVTGHEYLIPKADLPKPAGSKMKKWTCGCGINIRAAVEIDVTCNACGEKFERA